MRGCDDDDDDDDRGFASVVAMQSDGVSIDEVHGNTN